MSLCLYMLEKCATSSELTSFMGSMGTWLGEQSTQSSQFCRLVLVASNLIGSSSSLLVWQSSFSKGRSWVLTLGQISSVKEIEKEHF